MTEKKIYIILTGVHERKAFDLFNILRRNHRQYELLLFDYKDTKISLPLVYGMKVHRLSKDDFKLFENELLQALKNYREHTLIYIPLMDNYNGFFYRFMQAHPSVLTTAMPSFESFSTVIDKIKFQQFCESNQLPVPASFQKNNMNDLRNNFRPLIIKPKTGAGSVGISFISTKEELERFEQIDFSQYVVQERIDNINIEGGFFLMNKGQLVSYYGHRRIRVFPETGGVTVYSEYETKEELKNLGGNLLNKLQWHGIAMVEFLFDKQQGRYRIIEVNPRLWGSYLLSEFANTGFTENYINLCLGKPTREFQRRPNTRIRWLFPFDILLYVKRKGRIKGFWKLSRANTCYIDLTYARFFQAIRYMIYFTCNVNSFKRFFKKTASKKTV
ncbi:MAG: ATP-grasp domain-containing protein [Bacteroidetes bacterium]|nr:ATP-grasp domain-containing protein [Bacteroidota bacterium]